MSSAKNFRFKSSSVENFKLILFFDIEKLPQEGQNENEDRENRILQSYRILGAHYTKDNCNLLYSIFGYGFGIEGKTTKGHVILLV